MEFDNLFYEKNNSFFDAQIDTLKNKIQTTLSNIPTDQLHVVFSLFNSVKKSSYGLVELPNTGLLSFEGTRFFIKEQIQITALVNSLDSKSVIEADLTHLKYNTKGSVSHIVPEFFTQAFLYIKILENLKNDIIDYLTYLSLSMIHLNDKFYPLFSQFFEFQFRAPDQYLQDFSQQFDKSFNDYEFYVPCIDSESIYLRKIYIKRYGTKYVVDHKEQHKYNDKEIQQLLLAVFYINNTFFVLNNNNNDNYKKELITLSKQNNTAFLDKINQTHVLSNF